MLTLLIVAATADRILYLPPPNSVDDYIRVDFPSTGGSSITEVTITAWVRPTTMVRSHHGHFFSYMSSTRRDEDNMLLLGGMESKCLSFRVEGKELKTPSCSEYNIKDGKSISLILL